MATLSRIEASGLVFDALAEGPAEGPLVLLLHGFAESLHTWRAQLPALSAAGYRAVAPSQRGYSPGARPDAAEHANTAPRGPRIDDDLSPPATKLGGRICPTAEAVRASGTRRSP